ncbi:hypothetical protein BDW02DRAFT_610714, partial [Decorospora gaudefroyi]
VMEQQRIHSFISSPYQYAVDYSGPQDLIRCHSHDAFTPEALSTPPEAFDPRILEGAHCGSPLSTSSTISQSETVPTPPYIGLPMYDPYAHISDAPMCHTPSTSGAEQIWQSSYPEANQWGSPSYIFPGHSGPSDYVHMHLQPLQNFAPVVTSSGSQFSGFDTTSQYTQGRTNQAATSNLKEDDSDEKDCWDESDSDSDDSSFDGSSQGSSSSANKGCSSRANVMRLGHWGTRNIPTMPVAREYICDLQDVKNPDQRCPLRFVRPEHFRRHLKSVHSDYRGFVCKIHDCKTPFSRGDNLRDHYWTHLKRPGGRMGKNSKMEFAQLKAILGPKEKALVRRLKHKLKAHMNKQARQLKVKSKL